MRNKKQPKIIAVDFDGTLCENRYPKIGEENEDVLNYILGEQKNGARIILWTCRVGGLLQDAIKWCHEHNLYFDAVNANLPEVIDTFGDDARKIFANEYIDDRNKLVSACHEKSGLEIWAEKEVAIACKKEAPDKKENEFDYGCACYESALKAFKSLLEDGHSGTSIGFTRQILNRLIQNKPCVPIEDTDDNWVKVEMNAELEMYQCTRMSSLFKTVYPDGTLDYSDVNRFVVYDINNDEFGYHSSIITDLLNKMFPITMPYMPEDISYKVYVEKLLTDPKNGAYDTIALLDVICPDGTGIEVNRYFKESTDGFVEIEAKEYLKRGIMHNKLKREKKND